MKIVTWNINGLRAGNTRAPLQQILDSLQSDVICLQETKVTRDQLDDATANIDGYNSYFSFSKKRSGYSGVATFCRDSATPIRAEEGLSHVYSYTAKEDAIGCHGDMSEFTEEELESLDGEGRAVMTEHMLRRKDGTTKRLVIINVYCPRADYDNEHRVTYKLHFYKLLQKRAEAFLEEKKDVIIVGDINCSHKKIDHCDPPTDEEKYRTNPGRVWLNQMLRDISKDKDENKDQDVEHHTSKSNQPFVDTFRYCYPNQRKAFSCWSTLTSARETNYGTRIDYILGDVDFCRSELRDCQLLTEVYGSDHCPVRAEFESRFVPHDKCPALCAKYMPEFIGKQQKLSAFFKKVSPSSLKDDEPMISKKRLGTRLVQSNSKKLKLGSSNVRKPTLKAFFKTNDSNSEVDSKIEPKESESLSKNINGNTEGRSDTEKPATTDEKNVSAEVEDDAMKQEEEKKTTDDDPAQSSENLSSQTKKTKKLASSWKNILKGPPPPPLCKGHKEKCVLRTVKKAGPNLGKQFFVCSRPEGHKSNSEARCDHFEWVKDKILKAVEKNK